MTSRRTDPSCSVEISGCKLIGWESCKMMSKRNEGAGGRMPPRAQPQVQTQAGLGPLRWALGLKVPVPGLSRPLAGLQTSRVM